MNHNGLILASAILTAAFFLSFFVLFLIRRYRKNPLSESGIWGVRLLRFLLLCGAETLVDIGLRNNGTVSGFSQLAENIYASVKLFFADGTLGSLEPEQLAAVGQPFLTRYFLLYYLLCVVTMLFTAFTVLSFFRNVTESFRLRVLPRLGRPVFVFSELNDHTLAIAQELREDDPGYKKVLVFCNVRQREEDSSTEAGEKARLLRALCFDDDIFLVQKRIPGKHRTPPKNADFLLPGENPSFHYFLFGETEADNVHQAVEIAQWERGSAKKHYRLLISVLAHGEADGKILDLLNPDTENVPSFAVRRVDRARLTAWSAVENHPLVTPEKPEQNLKILIAGMGRYGIELMKALVWYYQRKEGAVTIYLSDSDPDVRDRLEGRLSGLFAASTPKGFSFPGDDARFSLQWLPACDLFGAEFARDFSRLGELNAIFVALGDDDANLEAALHLNTLYDRNHFREIYRSEEIRTENGQKILVRKKEPHGLKIFTIVHSDVKSRDFFDREKDRTLLADDGIPYCIEFIGNHRSVYRYRNLYDGTEEREAVRMHETQCLPRSRYNRSEYHRLSSRAAKKHDVLVRRLYPHLSDAKTRQRIEKFRWNAYLLTCGYLPVDPDITREERSELFDYTADGKTHPLRASVRRRWARGKWHNSIAPFSQIGKKEQENNAK